MHRPIMGNNDVYQKCSVKCNAQLLESEMVDWEFVEQWR